MRYISPLLLFLLFVSLPVMAQKERETTYQVTYKVIYRLDSLHRDDTGSTTLYLYTGPTYGVFTNSNVIARRKAIEKMKKKYGPDVDFDYSESSRNPSFNKVFYKNLQTGQVITDAKIGDKTYVFEEPEHSFDWQFADSTKTVQGYTVQKAYTSFASRDYVAWFTLEIPIPDGPYLFAGLPGLIIELYDTEDDYHFKLESIEKLDKPQSWEVPGKSKISKTEFLTKQKKFYKNAVMQTDWNYIMSNTPGMEGSITTDGTGKVISSDLKINGKQVSKNEMRRIYKKNLENQNNPIELK